MSVINQAETTPKPQQVKKQPTSSEIEDLLIYLFLENPDLRYKPYKVIQDIMKEKHDIVVTSSDLRLFYEPCLHFELEKIGSQIDDDLVEEDFFDSY